ncbi:MAG: TM2 domain-containing protein [Rhizobacter sp.]|nr:TM2 domain-containing protein [Rhizobacter sp.]
MSHHKSKTLAAWIAFIGGGLGLHRFYLHGSRDLFGWLWPIPTLIGAYGAIRAYTLGQDDQLSWLLVPLLGLAIATAMLAGIVYGLTPDEKWNARFNVGSAASTSGWGAVFAVVLCLLVGATVLMATIAYSGQRFFEYQVEEGRKISQ